MRARRLLYLFALFLPPALIAVTFQTFTLALPSGFEKDWSSIFSAQGLSGIITVPNLKWSFAAAALSAAGLLLFDKRLQTFWLIAVTWGSACLLADIVMMPAGSWHLIFAIDATADMNFGSAAGGLYIWVLASTIKRWGTRSRTLRSRTSENLMPLPHPLIIDFKAIVTGYAGLTLIALFWVFAIFGPVLLVLTSVIIDLRIAYFINGSGSGVLSDTLTVSNKYISMVLPLVLYLIALACLRDAINAVLGSRPRTSLAFFIIVTSVFLSANIIILTRHPEQIFTLNSLTINISTLICMVGLFSGSRTPKPLPATTTQPLRYWRASIFQIAATARSLRAYVPMPIYEALRIWFRAVRQPVKGMDRLLSIRNPATQTKKIWALAKASIMLSFLTSVPLFWYLNVRMKETLFRVPTYILLMLAVLVGGVTYHAVFRLCRRQSSLRKTMAIYAIPQLIFMPIISIISIPLLYSHFIIIGKVREMHLSLSQIPGQLLLLTLFSGHSGIVEGMLTFLIGLVTIGMQVLFLEAFWQTYTTSRVRSYAAGTLASLVTGIVVTFGIAPVRDFVVYLAGS